VGCRRGRLGCLITPDLLGFVSGGFTEGRFDAIDLSTVAIPISYPSHNYHGWFIGTGYEYVLNSFLPISGPFWRTEYRLSDYQAADLPLSTDALASHMQKDVQTITSGLVWRFNFGASSVATGY
jgi:hypothetical protein